MLFLLSHLGVVFPYHLRLGRYNMNFTKATQVCREQDAVVATYNQLLDAWRGGLDWCNAGWLRDGSVLYPITKPREPCGGANTQPGLRSYGHQDRRRLFDVFCFASTLKGYWLCCFFLWSLGSVYGCSQFLYLFFLSFLSSCQGLFTGWPSPTSWPLPKPFRHA